MSYNKDTDYQEKINNAVKSGNYKEAAEYEKSRNEKIDSENLGYEKTNKYSGWLDKNDYSEKIKSQIGAGASKSAVADTLKKRVSKASNTEGMEKYAYDDVYDQAMKYILSNNFTYNEKKPEYSDKYSSKINSLYDKLLHTDKFEYNPYDDELYKLYNEVYRREGSRAMEDTLGKLAANTGGVASSYAVGAASQAYDYYNSKTASKIPELYKLAYSMYTDAKSYDTDALKIGMQLGDSDYEKYLDMLKAYNDDREFEYDKYSDQVYDEYRNKNYERDIFENDRDYDLSERKFDNEKAENEHKWQQQEYENAFKESEAKIDAALNKWKQLGYLDTESAKVLGLPAGLKTSDHLYKEAQKYKIYNK